MGAILKFELLNITKRKEIKVVFIILLASTILNFITTCYLQYGLPMMNVKSSLDSSALININDLFISDIFKIFFPAIIALIYSDSYFIESKNNITQFIYTRENIKRVILIRMMLIFFVPMSIVLIPLIINYILTIITFPEITANQNSGMRTYEVYSYEFLEYLAKVGNPLSFLDYLYVYNNHYYNLFIILLKSISGGIFALISFSLSFYINKSRVIVIFSAFIICLIGVYLPEFIPFFDIELIYTADNFFISDFIITSIVLLIISIFLVYIKLKKGIAK